MSSLRWTPTVTVAAVIEDQGRFLLVEEHTPEGLRLNNPAGHLEPGESPLAAVVREALEETACVFTPEAVLGLYPWSYRRADSGEVLSYLRIAYRGRAGAPLPGRSLDKGIVRRLWLTPTEIHASADRHRSPLVLRCVEDHLAGRRFALDLIAADAGLTRPQTER